MVQHSYAMLSRGITPAPVYTKKIQATCGILDTLESAASLVCTSKECDSICKQYYGEEGQNINNIIMKQKETSCSNHLLIRVKRLLYLQLWFHFH